MGRKAIDMSHSKVFVGRRYLERGFLDLAMRLFMGNEALVEKRDWRLLAARLMERNRIIDVVRVCEIGNVPLPREQLLALGDGCLGRKDFEGTIRHYELGDAERERWARLFDVLTALPEQQRRAVAIAERHLVGEAEAAELRLAAAAN